MQSGDPRQPYTQAQQPYTAPYAPGTQAQNPYTQANTAFTQGMQAPNPFTQTQLPYTSPYVPGAQATYAQAGNTFQQSGPYAAQPGTGPFGADPYGDAQGQTAMQETAREDGARRRRTGRRSGGGGGRDRGVRILQFVIVAAVMALTILYLVNTFSTGGQAYATIQAGTLGAHYSGDVLIVRNEVPYDAEGVTSIEYVADEGRTVVRNLPICNVFSAGYSTREMSTLQEFRDQIRDYQKTLLESETTYDARMARAEADVLGRSKDVRDIIAGTRGSLTNQEKLLEAAIEARQQYLRQKYSSDQRLTRLYDDEQAQLQRIDSWTKQYVAATDTIVSFYSDGFEYGLNMSNYDQFTPAEVRRMVNGEKPATATQQKGKTTIYRTVTDGSWVALMLVDSGDWNPVEGQSYQLQLERFENTQVMATVQSFTRSGGELLVRLLIQGSVSPVLYMRTCKADLGDYVSTLMVPLKAVYHYQEMDGVVVVDGSNQSFIPVTVVNKDSRYAYVVAISQGLLFEGQTVRVF